MHKNASFLLKNCKNSLRIRARRFNSNMFRRGVKNSLDCNCGEPQTAQHIINDCAVVGSPKKSGPQKPQWSNNTLT